MNTKTCRIFIFYDSIKETDRKSNDCERDDDIRCG